MQKTLKVLKLMKVLLGFSLGFTVISSSETFSVIGYSSGSSVIDSSFMSSGLLFRHAAIFYQNVLLLSFIKSGCSVLYYIFKKKFTLNTL